MRSGSASLDANSVRGQGVGVVGCFRDCELMICTWSNVRQVCVCKAVSASCQTRRAGDSYLVERKAIVISL